MPKDAQNEDKTPAAEAQQDAAKAGDGKAETAAVTNPSDELSEVDLRAVAGGIGYYRDGTPSGRK